MSDSLQPRGLQPARLLCPWDSQGKDTGVGCHVLLQRIFPTEGSNPSFLQWGRVLYPMIATWEAQAKVWMTVNNNNVINIGSSTLRNELSKVKMVNKRRGWGVREREGMGDASLHFPPRRLST